MADTLSLCVLARETPEIIAVFLDHWRHAGVERFFLYVDSPGPGDAGPSDDVLAEPDTSVTLCDLAYWERHLGPEGADLDSKMLHVRMDAIARNTSDWIMFCDADELPGPEGYLREALAELPAETPGVMIRNTEAVWSDADTAWGPFSCSLERMPFPGKPAAQRALAQQIYGDAGSGLRRGTTGYASGKHLLRRGVRPETMKSHASIVGGRLVPLLHEMLPGAHPIRLLHYDALSFERWQKKCTDRWTGKTLTTQMSPPRLRYMEIAAASIASGQAEEAFRRFNTLTEAQFEQLRELGLAARLPERSA